MPQASLVAPQAVPTETFAILVNPSPNLGSFAAILSTMGKCDTARFSYFPETLNSEQFAALSHCPCMDLESIDRSAPNPPPSVRVLIGSASQTLLARGGVAGRTAGR